MRKKNLFKKLIATAGAMVMALTMMMPMGVSAASTFTGRENVSLTIEKHKGDSTGLDSAITGTEDSSVSGDPMANVQFTAVKIANISQGQNASNQETVLYALTQDGATLIGDDANENDERTGNQLQTWVANRSASSFDTLLGTGSSITSKVTGTTGSDGRILFTSNSDDVISGDESTKQIDGQGLYLIVETYAPDTVITRSHPFIVSLPMTDKANQNKWIFNVYAYPKNNTATRSVGKDITEINNASSTNIADGGASAQANIGDIITYQVPVLAVVPDAGLTQLGITDTMSKGLTFQKAGATAASTDVDVYTGIEINEDNKVDTSNYSVSATTDEESGVTTLTVNFTLNYLNTVVNTSTDKNPNFLFVYRAELNENAVLGTTGNTNSVDMVYNYTNNPLPVTVEGETTTVYTWGIDLTKQGDDGDSLVGVQFTLSENNSNLTFVYDEEIGAYVPGTGSGASNTLTSRTGGKIVIRGLDKGTYTLTETKTNSGYTLLKDSIDIMIVGNTSTGSADGSTVDGENVTVNSDGNSSYALVPLTVVNNKGFDLPQTGAAGTALFAIVGIVLAAVAGGLLFFLKKSPKRK